VAGIRVSGFHSNQQKIAERALKELDSDKLESDIKVAHQLEVKANPRTKEKRFAKLGITAGWKGNLNIPLLFTVACQLFSSSVDTAKIADGSNSTLKDSTLDIVSFIAFVVGMTGPILIHHFEERNHARETKAVDHRHFALKMLSLIEAGKLTNTQLQQIREDFESAQIETIPPTDPQVSSVGAPIDSNRLSSPSTAPITQNATTSTIDIEIAPKNVSPMVALSSQPGVSAGASGDPNTASSSSRATTAESTTALINDRGAESKSLPTTAPSTQLSWVANIVARIKKPATDAPGAIPRSPTFP
jgi:hypothetical protein